LLAAMSHRLVALVLAGVFLTSAASTATEQCAGWSRSVADAHACCRTGAMTRDARATACCAMTQQSGDAGPIEARVAAVPITYVRHAAPSFAVAVTVSAAAVPDARPRVPGPSSVPLYLRQLSLLI
jgi:hypothetical protein